MESVLNRAVVAPVPVPVQVQVQVPVPVQVPVQVQVPARGPRVAGSAPPPSAREPARHQPG